MQEFITDLFVPAWNNVVEQISTREREIGVIQKGGEYIWSQFFKDIRKFYRLMFKLRFHRSDKRKNENRTTLIRRFVYELGMTIVDFDEQEAFYFFYPILTKLRKDSEPKITNENLAISVFKQFNEASKDLFIKHILFSQLICFFLLNFSEEYINKMNYGFRVNLQKISKRLIKLYTDECN